MEVLQDKFRSSLDLRTCQGHGSDAELGKEGLAAPFCFSTITEVQSPSSPAPGERILPNRPIEPGLPLFGDIEVHG